MNQTLDKENMNMDQTKSDQLSPHSVYFTEFDRVTYSQVAWTPNDVEEIKRNLNRKLKLLTLTKGHVVTYRCQAYTVDKEANSVSKL